MLMSDRPADPYFWAHLQAKDACRDLILAAADAVDQQDYKALVELFCEDAVLVRPGGAALHGRAEILASYALKDPNRLTHHMVCNHRIHIFESGQTAHSRCRVLLYVSDKRLEVSIQGRLANANHQIGTIEDELVQTKVGWKISKRTAWFDVFSPA
jgi:ketosteroid isomerase-like protein